MEDYRNYIRHKSLETLISTVLMVFVLVGVFLVGTALSPERKYISEYAVSVAQN